MPEKEMNAIERIIHTLVGPGSTKAPGGWLFSSLPHILQTVSQAFTRIAEKGKSQGYTLDEDTEKEILGRCMYECLNKLIYEEVRKRLVSEERTYSTQPMLVAHPSHIRSMIRKELEEDPDKNEWEVMRKCGYRLDQIESETISKLMKDHLAIVPKFLPNADFKVLVPKLLKRLELMEMEGRFEISRQGFILPPD
jgi:hypothetical protein